MSEPSQLCPACGATIGAEDRFCPRCGAALPSPPAVPSDEVAPDTAEHDAALAAMLEEALSPNYLLVRRLGAGGMGNVYLARDPALKRLVAVKVLAIHLAQDAGSRARFQREAQAVAGLSHPNIVAIHAVGELQDGTPYFVMQYVGGRSMAARLEEDGPLDPERARRVVGEVASALAAAHKQGVIHRDIKPANILFDDESGRALVSDFGIAAVRREEVSGEDATRLTATGMAVGTPMYMSPEQLLAEKVTDRTDVYALGLLAYELLAGAGPFKATSPQELVAAHLRDTPRRIAEVRNDVDPELEQVVTSCLAKAPEDRPSAEEVAKRLLPGAGTLLEWPPPGLESLQGQLPRLAGTFWAGSLLTAASGIAMVAFGASLTGPAASLGALAVWLSAAAGLITLGVALRRTLRVGGAIAEALRVGFGWLTIGEVAADRRRDGGMLVTGMREYAALGAAQRNTLRRDRVWRETLGFLGSVLPLPSFLALAWLGSAEAVQPLAAPWVVLGPSMLLLILSVALEVREKRGVGPVRRQLDRAATSATQREHLVSPWHESFDAARRGQRLGVGPGGAPSAGRLPAIVVVLGLLLTLGVAAPIAVVGLVVPVWAANAIPRFTATQERARIAMAMRAYAVEPDSTITPQDAGRALYTLLQGPRSDEIPMHALPREIGTDWTRDSLSPFEGHGLPDVLDTLWQRSVRGLSPGEARYLEAIAAHPGFAEFRTVARAPAVDFVGAAFVQPFPDSVSFSMYPIPRYAPVRDAGYASVARAIWLHTQGRTDEAERQLRETISFGLNLVNGHLLIESLIGTVVTGAGRRGLEQFYLVTDRFDEAQGVRARYDSAQAVNEALAAATAEDQGPATFRDAHRERLRILNDTTALRSLRIEMLHGIPFVVCTNARDLLFGQGAEERAILDHADSLLVRHPWEREWIAFLLRRDVYRPGGFAGRRALDLARLSGTALGNDRVAWCAGIVLSSF